LRKQRGQQRLLHVLLYQGRGNQIDSGPLQLHLCEGRKRLENRRSPLVGGASPAQVSRIQSRAIAVIMACARSGCSCWAPDKAANASRQRCPICRAGAGGVVVAVLGSPAAPPPYRNVEDGLKR